MMPDSILYNQEVTAEILNDIAIDLGNTSFNGFGDDKFGADELNDITASLVSKGVLLSGEKCKPVLQNDTVIIQTGTMVFENGAKKKITEPVSLPKVLGSHIYALNKTVAGTCEIIVSENDPSTDENVMLQDYFLIAEITSEGELTDRRQISTSKVIMPVDVEPITEYIAISLPYSSGESVAVASFDFGRVIRGASYTSKSGTRVFAEVNSVGTDMTSLENYKVGSYHYSIANNTNIGFCMEGTSVVVYCYHYNTYVGTGIDVTFY